MKVGPRRAPSRPCPRAAASPMPIQTRSDRRRRRSRTRQKEQERARQAELERLSDVAVVRAEPAVGVSVDGVEPARMDDLVDPRDQAQGRERDRRPEPGGHGPRRETGRRRMGIRGRRRALPTTRRHRGSEFPGARSSGHSRAQPGEDSRGARPAGSSRDGAAGKRAGRTPWRQIDHGMQGVARGHVGKPCRRERDNPAEEGCELEVERHARPSVGSSAVDVPGTGVRRDHDCELHSRATCVKAPASRSP